MSIEAEVTTVQSEVDRRVAQFIADNPRQNLDFLVCQTLALIGVSVAMEAMDRYGEIADVLEEIFDETKLR